MNKKHVPPLSAALFCTCAFTAMPSAAELSPAAIEGKALYPSCHVCHSPDIDPPLGPPMWGVKKRYKNNTIDDEDFIDSMVSFVKKPTLESARHDRAVARLGLMQALPLPDDMLKKIATYILEEKFPPPCEHWTIGIKAATEQGDVEQAQREQRAFDRYCK